MADNIDLARLVVTMEAQAEKYLRDLKKQRTETNKWKKKTVANVKSVGKAFRALAAAAGIGLLTRKVIANTKAQTRAIGQLRQGWITTGGLVGRTVDEMIKEASRLQDISIFGDETIIEAQSQLITFTNIVEDNFDRATEAALNLSVRMGVDLKSSIVQLGKVLNAPASQLSQLARSGIMFNETQTEMIKKLTKTGRIVEAQTIILDELETQFGGSAEAARKDFGGALTGLSNAFGDLLEGGGGKGGLNENVAKVEELTSLLKDPDTVASAKTLTTALIDGFTNSLGAINSVVTAMQNVGKTIGRIVSGNKKSLVEQKEDIKAEMAEILEALDIPAVLEHPSSIVRSDRLRVLNEQLKEIEATQTLIAKNKKDPLVEDGAPDKPKPPPLLPEDLIVPLTDKQVTAAIEKLTTQLATEEEAVRSSFKKNQEMLEEALARKLTTQEEFDELEKRNKEKKNKFFIEKEKELEEAKMEVGMAMLDFGIALAKDGSKAERALLAVQKAVAIRQALINLQAAMSKALATAWPANIVAVGQVAGIGAGIIGTLRGIDTSVPSFEGGGFTGSGSRSGGVDGRGGFNAVLHPNEVISDLAAGGGAGMVKFENYYDLRGSDLSIAQVAGMIQQGNEIQKAQIQKLITQGKFF